MRGAFHWRGKRKRPLTHRPDLLPFLLPFFSPNPSLFGEHTMPRQPIGPGKVSPRASHCGTPPHAMRRERIREDSDGDERVSKAREKTGEVSGRLVANDWYTFVRRSLTRKGETAVCERRVSGRGFAPTRNPIPPPLPRGHHLLEQRLYPMPISVVRDDLSRRRRPDIASS